MVETLVNVKNVAYVKVDNRKDRYVITYYFDNNTPPMECHYQSEIELAAMYKKLQREAKFLTVGNGVNEDGVTWMSDYLEYVRRTKLDEKLPKMLHRLRDWYEDLVGARKINQALRNNDLYTEEQINNLHDGLRESIGVARSQKGKSKEKSLSQIKDEINSVISKSKLLRKKFGIDDGGDDDKHTVFVEEEATK